jgi:hypothetical protein
MEPYIEAIIVTSKLLKASMSTSANVNLDSLTVTVLLLLNT